MAISFKKWFYLQELALGSDGMRDNEPAQTAQDTLAVAQKYLSNPKNAEEIATLRTLPRSKLVKPLYQTSANAVKTAPHQELKQSDPTQVAFHLANSLGLPKNIVKPPTLGTFKAMRKQ